MYRLIVLSFSLILLSACLPGNPQSKEQLAMDGIYSASISSNGQSAVIGSFKHGGSFWDLTRNARLYNWNHRDGYITDILFSDISDDGQFALTANYYNLVLWNGKTGQSVAFWEAPARIEAIDLSSDGRFALLGLDNSKAVLFDVVNGGVLREFEHNGPVKSVSLNIESGRALTGSEDTMARLWDIRNAELIRSFDYQNHVSLVKLSDSGEKALMVPANEKAEIWNLTARRKIAELKTAKFRLYSAEFVGDSRLLVGTTHRNIFEYDANTGKRLSRWQIGTDGRESFKAAFVIDLAWRGSKLVAIGSNGYIYTF